MFECSTVTDHILFHDFPIVGIEPMTASTARAYPRHTHDQYGVGLVDAGGHASWSGRGQVEAGPGSFICTNAGEVHDGRAVGRGPRAWRILYLDPEVLEQLRSDICEHRQATFMFTAPVFADPQLHGMFETAFGHANGGVGTDQMACESAILSLVGRLHMHSTTPGRQGGHSACIWRARARIDDDPTASLMLADLAMEAGLSRYQLLRGFARELGLTPHAYIMQQRLALARRLIRGGRTLAEVAVSAGFHD
jgi:AraC-like DNA-binding protein